LTGCAGGSIVPSMEERAVRQVTVVSDQVRTVEASVDRGRVLIERDRLPSALGWELKSEGLCRDDVCIPVRDVDSLFVGGDLDLEAVAGALHRAVVVDADAGLAAMALPAEERARALDALEAPPFTLADLDGRPHDLEEWRGRKKLLVAFASW
jgi:hypothetical protein